MICRHACMWKWRVSSLRVTLPIKPWISHFLPIKIVCYPKLFLRWWYVAFRLYSLSTSATFTIVSENWLKFTAAGNPLMGTKQIEVTQCSFWYASAVILQPSLKLLDFVENTDYHLRAPLLTFSITWHCGENCKSHEIEKKKQSHPTNLCSRTLICLLQSSKHYLARKVKIQ